MKNNNVSSYKLSKITGIPYMTINDLINEKTSIAKCNCETVYKIAEALGTTVEKLIKPVVTPRPTFENFKSYICHQLKELGDLDFLLDVLDNDRINELYDFEWYPECFYLLAMFDYISRINNVPICSDYDELRTMKLTEVIYPSDIIILDVVNNSDEAKQKAWNNSIPEFKKYNIVEVEVRNAV